MWLADKVFALVIAVDAFWNCCRQVIIIEVNYEVMALPLCRYGDCTSHRSDYTAVTMLRNASTGRWTVPCNSHISVESCHAIQLNAKTHQCRAFPIYFDSFPGVCVPAWQIGLTKSFIFIWQSLGGKLFV